MFQRRKIQSLDDFFIEMNKRRENGIYFYRINGYNEQIALFIEKYYMSAKSSGIIIEGKIPNPDNNSLAYYNEIMGMNFQMSMDFILQSLKKWLPRMNDFQRNNVASSIYNNLDIMRKNGKNENMLKNAYIKLMCGLYYKFERIVNQLGMNTVPKILYQGAISSYELMLISVLANAGSDIVLLQYNGDSSYLRLDPDSQLSYNLQIPNMTSFPENFNLKLVSSQIESKINTERLYGKKPDVFNCTNSWITGNGLADILVPPANRGDDTRFFYNCFIKVNGVEDKVTYLSDLYKFYTDVKATNRKLLIIDKEIPKPTTDEISKINRSNYNRQDIMLMDLSKNLNNISNILLQRLITKAFIDTILEVSKAEGMTLSKLTNKAVYLLCWIKRYYQHLFTNWQMPNIACFIYMGGCKNNNEAMFLAFLSKLPVDVLILVPDLNLKCCLSDKSLYIINNTASMEVDKFPTDNVGIHMGTAAYHAERELDTIMYQASGMYRNRQYAKGMALTLQTMYEEIAILWGQELKYRPNFSVSENMVNMPVIFAKVSGVKDAELQKYWASIKNLMVNDTYVISNVPFIKSDIANPIKSVSAELLRNGKLQIQKIKNNKYYQYSFLREEVQDYILEKLQILINLQLIKGTFENGMEYLILSTILNMPKDIVRMIQNFDFTKKNPKLIYIYLDESPVTVEDAILTAYLNLVGFDIVFFVPTGYQCVEKYFNKPILEEHQYGGYMYDLTIPNFKKISTETRQPWHRKLFRRGN